MDANRLLLVVLVPLLVTNAVAWLLWSHQPIVAGVWLLLIYPCVRYLGER
jgi:hypothetical protein